MGIESAAPRARCSASLEACPMRRAAERQGTPHPLGGMERVGGISPLLRRAGSRAIKRPHARRQLGEPQKLHELVPVAELILAARGLRDGDGTVVSEIL